MTAPPLTLQHRPARVTAPCHFLFGEDSPLAGVIDDLDPDSPNLKSGTVTGVKYKPCLLYTSPSPRDLSTSRMPSSA